MTSRPTLGPESRRDPDRREHAPGAAAALLPKLRDRATSSQRTRAQRGRGVQPLEDRLRQAGGGDEPDQPVTS